MTVAEHFYEDFLAKFMRWAEDNNDIRAAFVVGSRARIEYPADAYSDLDIIFFCVNQSSYIANTAWLNEFGTVWAVNISQKTGIDPELKIIFEGGYQVDFVIHSASVLRQMVLRKHCPTDFLRGAKYIVDKDSVSQYILPSNTISPPLKPITEELFRQVVNEFWCTALLTAKLILRDALWVAKDRDADMKSLLLQMIEWHQRVTNGEEHFIWDSGRYISQWASTDIVEDLESAYGRFNKEDSWNALQVTMKLFRRLSSAVADLMNYKYSAGLEENVYQWVANNSIITMDNVTLRTVWVQQDR